MRRWLGSDLLHNLALVNADGTNKRHLVAASGSFLDVVWLNKLNEFGGDFRRAEMVKAFIISGEYRHRFGQP